MNAVRARREALRVAFSQHRLAKMTGIPQTKISLVERGLIDPTPEEQRKIAHALGSTVDALWPHVEDATDACLVGSQTGC